ncbi:3-deoxy-D-manno-octulosonic acid transferase [Nitrospina sp. 32_T5]|uniref:3-deoxy-D-manno-octulosonic acid transferase n=1 Tax=unclassified Nitrospina TaxID=2638683 RepID=UPI003F984EC5
MPLLYHTLSTLAAVLVLPLFFFYCIINGKKTRGLGHHFGYVPSVKRKEGRPLVWVQALSFGEVNAAAPVLRRLHEDRPDLDIVVSVTTDSGYDGACRQIPFARTIFFHPLDCWPFLNLALARIRPDLYVLTDTGFWPGMIYLLKTRGIPQVLFNGRLSEKSLKCYGFVKPWVRGLLNRFDLICMQSEAGRQAMVSLGARPEILRVVGDTKYDGLKPVGEPEGFRLREALRIPASHPVWVAGSTHPGEEAIVLDSYEQLRVRFPKLTLVLAPRRLERVGEVMGLIEARGLNAVRKSELKPDDSHGRDVIVLDTMGELAKLYAVADVTFVGRSLIAPGGGHSLIEPAAQGKVVLHGPHVENVQHSADELGTLGIAIEVADADAMAKRITELFEEDTLHARLTEKAVTLVKEKKGASREMAALILRALDGAE